MRKEIQEFAEQMEKVMAAQDATKGDSWKSMTAEKLVQLMNTKLKGGRAHYGFGEYPNDYVDVANFCMMVWTVGWKKKEAKP